MIDLFLIRHGSTEANEFANGKLMCGSTNIHLSKKGMEQSRIVGENTNWSSLTDALSSVSKIYCSTLDRTYETAQNMFPELILKGVPVVKEECFDEINFGKYEMMRKEELPANILDFWKNNPAELTFPLGDNIAERTIKAHVKILEIARESTKPVVIISSCTILRCLLTRIAGLPIKEFHNIPMDNCQVYHLLFDEIREEFFVIS